MTPKEKHQQEKFFIEQSPDEIGDNIKEKIKAAGLEEWQRAAIIELFIKNKISDAVGRLSELADLTDKEKEHFKSVPIEIILKWFGVKEEKE